MGVFDLIVNAFVVTQFLPFWTPIYYVISLYIGYIVYRVVIFGYNQRRFRERVIRKRFEQQRNFEIAREFVNTIPSTTREQIQRMTYEDVKRKLKNKEVTCVQVLAAVVERCLTTNILNAVNLFILDAVNVAKEWDNRASEAGFEHPPLFGIPISVKESTMVKDCAQTLGFITRSDNKAERHSIIIQKLVEKGAIPFCVTNVPQTLLTFDCQNPIYGATKNSHLNDRTSGGSSGGEAALVGAKASFVGIGSDVGGSIRIPAHFCGVVGMKPGGTRLSRKDGIGSLPGRPLIEASDGPIGRTVQACVDILSNLIDAEMSEADPYVPPVPWRNDIFLNGKKKMTIGYYVDDGWFEPCPAVKNAVLKAVDCLKDRGYTVVKFTPPDVATAFRIMLGGITVDGGSYLIDAVSQDILQSGYLEVLFPFMLPYSVKMLLAYTVGLFIPRVRTMLSALPGSTSDLRQIYAEIKDYRNRFVETMKKDNIDLILCPPNAGMAYRLGEPLKLVPTTSYSALYNMLDFPAGVVPARFSTKEDIEEMKNYKVKDFWDRLFKFSMSDPKLSSMPVCVQVVGPPYSEELVCFLMKTIEAELGQYCESA